MRFDRRFPIAVQIAEPFPDIHFLAWPAAERDGTVQTLMQQVGLRADQAQAIP